MASRSTWWLLMLTWIITATLAAIWSTSKFMLTMDISQRCPLTSSWRRKMEGHLSSVEATVWGQECTQDIGQATTWQIGSFCGSPSAEISYSKFSAFKWSVLISVDFIVSDWLFRKHQWGVVLEMDASRVLLSLRQEPQRERKHSSGAVPIRK